jgi:hypothetical protein
MNSLNTIIANAMEKSKLGEVGFDEHDIFCPPSMEEKIYFDDTMPPIYDEYDIFSPPTIEEKIRYDYNMSPIFNDYVILPFCITILYHNLLLFIDIFYIYR